MMANQKLTACALSGLLSCCVLSTTASANVWVIEPSAALDQRVDDNYTIDARRADPVNVTRLVGSLGLSRESQNTAFKGLLRVDGLLQNSAVEGNNDSDLSSNQILFLDTKVNSARTTYGVGVNYKQDTPSRDISADITDLSVTAADTGASVTQDQNTARQRLALTPNWEYKLSRRTSISANLAYTSVAHDLPSVEDAILAQWKRFSDLAPPEDLNINTPGIGVFQVEDELDNFQEAAIGFGWNHQVTPLSEVSASVSYRGYQSEVELDTDIVDLAFDDQIPDPRERQILRKPRRTSKSSTGTVKFGYKRSLSPTLKLGFSLGAYTNVKDDTDLYRSTDTIIATQQEYDAALANATAVGNGWLGGVTLTKTTGATQYSARFGVDVLPSDAGSQVESLDLVGDIVRQINPRLSASMRARAYEPDAINAPGGDEFSRRFLSFEPKIVWEYSRSWTIAGSYRYRRQKSVGDFQSGQSNAFLVSLKYTPPSAIRDAVNQGQ